MYDWSWKTEHILTDMIDEVDKKYGGEVEIYIMDFDCNEFDYDDEFVAEKLSRIYIEYKNEAISLEKFGDTYEFDGFVPITYMEVLSGALIIVSKYLKEIEDVLEANGYYGQS